MAGRKKQSAVIFGASLAGQRTYRYYANTYRIIGFADNDPKKHGSTMLRLPVYAPADLPGLDVDCFLIGSSYSGEITRQLQALGIADSRIGWVNGGVLEGHYDSAHLFRAAAKIAAVFAAVVLLVLIFAFVA